MAPMVKIDGLTLDKAIAHIHQSWDNKFPGTVLEITLFEIRTFRVTVSGAVVEPGMYEATPADRVAGLLAIAGGVKSRDYYLEVFKDNLELPVRTLDDIKDEYNFNYASMRNCWLIRRSGELIHVDLLHYRRGGGDKKKSTLLDGDKIVVNYISENAPTTEIGGAVSIPDEYEWVEGDRIEDLLAIAGGALPNADLTQVTLTRFNEVSIEGSRIIDMTPVLSGETESPELLPGDLIFVKYKDGQAERKSVYITGEIESPGVYPIVDGVTTVQDIVKLAGGFTGNAFLHGATVKRNIPRNNFQEREALRLLAEPSQQRQTTEQQYLMFQRRWEGFNRLGLDFSTLFDDEKGDANNFFHLEDGDVIEVPNQKRSVLVIGTVLHPGLYPYIKDWTYIDYIRNAGGYASNSRPGLARMVSYESNMWMKPNKKTPVQAGSVILVPEAPPNYGWTMFKDILLVASQAATIIVVILNFTS